jgi:hypothetical protein
MPSPVMRRTLARQLVVECLGHRVGMGSVVKRMPGINNRDVKITGRSLELPLNHVGLREAERGSRIKAEEDCP